VIYFTPQIIHLTHHTSHLTPHSYPPLVFNYFIDEEYDIRKILDGSEEWKILTKTTINRPRRNAGEEHSSTVLLEKFGSICEPFNEQSKCPEINPQHEPSHLTIPKRS
jgi:hypothetical protein